MIDTGIHGTALLLWGGGALIGLLLSVLGAGGSILLLPLLVSGVALSTREAVPLSLLVVLVLALGNLVPYLRRGSSRLEPLWRLGFPPFWAAGLGAVG